MNQEINEASPKPDKKGWDKGDEFEIMIDIGHFKAGDKLTLENVKYTNTDIELHFVNAHGIKDVLYVDKNDI